MAQHFRRISGHDRIRRNILGYDASGTHDGIFTDGQVCQYRGTGAYRGAFLYDCPFDLPVRLGLEPAVSRCCARVRIVDESHAVTDESVIFDGHAFTDKRVTRNLAILPN